MPCWIFSSIPSHWIQEHLPPPVVTTKIVSGHCQIGVGGSLGNLLRQMLSAPPLQHIRHPGDRPPPRSPHTRNPPRSPSRGHTPGVPQWGRSSTHRSARPFSLLCHESELKLGHRHGANRSSLNCLAAEMMPDPSSIFPAPIRASNMNYYLNKCLREGEIF